VPCWIQKAELTLRRSFMKVVFRSDASIFMGQGHVMRCLTLADVLQTIGVEISFVCRKHPGHLCDLIAQRGFRIHCLPLVSEESSQLPGHAGWFGSSWETDAEQTCHAIQILCGVADFLIVDHYAADHRWESKLRSSAKRIMAIDDLADRLHDCDILLDQNFFSELSSRYRDKVPPGCVTLLGPNYALLQPVYTQLHSKAALRDGPVRRIFVFFGGADSENLTGRSVTAFKRLGRTDIHLDVVMTEKNSRFHHIESEIEGWAKIQIHGPLPSLGPLMATADLAIGAGGANVWERLCLGLPSIVISLAENQKPVCDELARVGLIQYLGHVDHIATDALVTALEMAVSLPTMYEQSRTCLSICDGEGARRVAENIRPPDLQTV
jgi:UDP-2,4-diacetamido-2,4,6-trideoxy-beta-L-altropyranose hydrolase